MAAFTMYFDGTAPLRLLIGLTWVDIRAAWGMEIPHVRPVKDFTLDTGVRYDPERKCLLWNPAHVQATRAWFGDTVVRDAIYAEAENAARLTLGDQFEHVARKRREYAEKRKEREGAA